MTGTPLNSNRLVFLDNIRYFIIFFVILQHVALIYIGQAGRGTVLQQLFQLIISITDVFIMPPLFFVAGYFALKSMKRHGTANFVAGKFKRIWLPWLAGVLLLIPISLFCLRMAEQGDVSMRFYPYWLNFMKSAVAFHTGYYVSGQFTPRHLWFLSNLFVFFLGFAGFREVYKRISARKPLATVQPDGKHFSPLIVLTIVAILSGLAFFVASLAFTWGYRAITVLNLIYFEPSRVTFYIIYFIVGIYAAPRNWFDGNARLGRPIVWCAASLVLVAVFSYVILFLPFDMPTGGKFLVSILRSAVCIAMFGAMMTCGRVYWNRPNPVDSIFSRNSYTVYIIHYPINAALAMLLMTLAAPVMVKAAILFITTAALSYLASEYAVRKYAGYAVGAAVLMNVVMLAVL
jgi:surface polysaccharide O-acyltransferase-like enzyme